MSAAIIHTIELRSNDDYAASYWVADQTVDPAVGINTIGWTLKLQAWLVPGTVALTLDVVARGQEGFAAVDQANGEWELRISDTTASTLLGAKSYVKIAYDVQATLPDGDVAVVDEGFITIVKGITT